MPENRRQRTLPELLDLLAARLEAIKIRTDELSSQQEQLCAQMRSIGGLVDRTLDDLTTEVQAMHQARDLP